MRLKMGARVDVAGSSVVTGPDEGFVLSIDLEDWHQLVRRSVRADGWDTPHPSFERQVGVILDLLDELGVRATFFVLGMCAKNYPAVVAEVASRGHEIACHGDAHVRVYLQTPEEFRRDVEASVGLIEDICGRRPVGYRAPVFSINRDSLWAYEILADLGFRYDSSQYDSPKVPRRIQGIPADPYRLQLGSGRELWEFPVAVWHVGSRVVPIGGGGYWRVLPNRLLLRGLGQVKRSSTWPVLYFHPYEFDPLPLRVELPRSAAPKQRLKAASRSLYRTPGRRRLVAQLSRVAAAFPLLTYEALLGHHALGNAGAKTLSPGGAVV